MPHLMPWHIFAEVVVCVLMIREPINNNRAAYTPQEFASLFGREKTWTYRQLYKGRLNAIKGYGSMLIPATEVNRYLDQAEPLSEAVSRD